MKILLALIITAGLLAFMLTPFLHEFGTNKHGDQNFKWFIDFRYVLFETDYIKSFFIFIGAAAYSALAVISILAIIFHT